MKLSSKKRVVILDSHAILHRSYHAIPGLATTSGEPTGALFGVASMLLRIGKDLKPDYVIACRDLPGGTFRHTQYEEYKGTRAQIDDALISQLQKAPEVFKAFGVPVYEAPGFEADDCVGTIVYQLRDRDDLDIVIATGDMDTLQLVRDGVSVYTFGKGISETITYDRDRVMERYGFGPEHVIDYKALRGDPSDNIPGIKGIGEKTATDMIVNFGSLDNIYKTLEKNEDLLVKAGIKARMIELLRNGKESAYMSYSLATIRHDTPITFTLPDHDWRVSDHIETAMAMCEELEFNSFKTRLQALAKQDAAKNQSSFGDMFENSVADESRVQEEVDPVQLKEASVGIWLLRSDISNPSLEDILLATKKKTFREAYEYIFEEIKKTGRLQEVYDTIEKPLIEIVDRMHTDGVRVDVPYLKTLSVEYSKELKSIEKRIHKHAGHEFNISSPKQLGVVLYDELGLTLEKQKKTASGARTTREDELVKMAGQHPIIEDVLAYRELSKLLSTYIEKIPALVESDGRLHAYFLQAGTTTGRMASESPNLQNIPIKTEYGRRIRGAFKAGEGNVMVSLDYSQVELRIAAAISGDEKLIKTFQENQDVHTTVASEVFGVDPQHVTSDMRRKAKVINFGILYGMGVNALRGSLGSDVSRTQASEFLDAYFKKFPRLREYIDKTKFDAQQNGYTETLFGRRRYFAGFKTNQSALIAQAERMAINAPIQGTQADIIKLAMIQTSEMIHQKYSKETVRLVLQVHDELVYEMEKSVAMKATHDIKYIMEHIIAPEMIAQVPLVVDAAEGPSWGEMKDIEA
jgi:DNA polymerase-1